MKLTPREESIAGAAFMHGYNMGHNDTVEGTWFGEDPNAAYELIMEHVADGGLEDGMQKIEEG